MFFPPYAWSYGSVSVWLDLVFGKLRSRERIVKMKIPKIIITGASRIKKKNKSVVALAHITPLSAK
ncbi:hypothetical protein [Desulfonauticus submarinus]|uniref:hypothetical protein n=1 Tax=Desulfonauticus submarinus TaxID=206665 RepID=UPI000B815469|nr:hypothetical protein [Desulfonauticus submarinus]